MVSRKLPCRLAYVPTVVENEGGNRERTFDIYSRLLRDRIILIGRPIDDVVANLVVAQLMYLAADDPDKEIQIYINSPGGAVTAGARRTRHRPRLLPLAAGSRRVWADRRHHRADTGTGPGDLQVIKPAARRQAQAITAMPTNAGAGAGATAQKRAATDSASQSNHRA